MGLLEVDVHDQVHLLADSIIHDTGWYIVESVIGTEQDLRTGGARYFVHWLRNLHIEMDLLMIGDDGKYYNIEEKYPRKAEKLFRQLTANIV